MHPSEQSYRKGGKLLVQQWTGEDVLLLMSLPAVSLCLQATQRSSNFASAQAVDIVDGLLPPESHSLKALLIPSSWPVSEKSHRASELKGTMATTQFSHNTNELLSIFQRVSAKGTCFPKEISRHQFTSAGGFFSWRPLFSPLSSQNGHPLFQASNVKLVSIAGTYSVFKVGSGVSTNFRLYPDIVTVKLNASIWAKSSSGCVCKFINVTILTKH